MFRQINGWPEALSPVFVGFSESYKSNFVRLALVALFVFFVWQAKLRRAAIVGVLAWLASDSLCNVLKAGFQGLRPSVELIDAIVRVDGGHGFGTASAHAASTMAIATAFWFVDRRWSGAWIAASILTGLSRIYVGVHYPSQVLLGWVLGATVSTVFYMVSVRLVPGKTEISEEPEEVG